VSCVQRTGDLAACRSGMDAYYPVSISSCDELKRYECGLAQQCPECGTCQGLQIALANCLNAGTCDPFTCPGPSLAPSPAPAPLPPSAGPTGNPTLSVAEEPTRNPAPSEGDPTRRPAPTASTSGAIMVTDSLARHGLTAMMALVLALV
jgi:hypothetical protein